MHSSVHQERGDIAEECSEDCGNVYAELALGDRVVHQLHPAVASVLINGEGSVAQAEFGMAALLQIVLRSAETKDQEQSQPFFCTSQIARRIHRAQNIVIGHLPVERSHDSGDPVRTNDAVNTVFGQ